MNLFLFERNFFYLFIYLFPSFAKVLHKNHPAKRISVQSENNTCDTHRKSKSHFASQYGFTLHGIFFDWTCIIFLSDNNTNKYKSYFHLFAGDASNSCRRTGRIKPKFHSGVSFYLNEFQSKDKKKQMGQAHLLCLTICPLLNNFGYRTCSNRTSAFTNGELGSFFDGDR